MRWDGSSRPTIWIVPAPDVDPGVARMELARRYLHVLGPGTGDTFAEWAGIPPSSGRATFEAMAGTLTPVRTAVGDGWILGDDEEAFRGAVERPVAPARLLPSGDTFMLLWGPARDLIVANPQHRRDLWPPRVWPGAVLSTGSSQGHGDGLARSSPSTRGAASRSWLARASSARCGRSRSRISDARSELDGRRDARRPPAWSRWSCGCSPWGAPSHAGIVTRPAAHPGPARQRRNAPGRRAEKAGSTGINDWLSSSNATLRSGPSSNARRSSARAPRSRRPGTGVEAAQHDVEGGEDLGRREGAMAGSLGEQLTQGASVPGPADGRLVGLLVLDRRELTPAPGRRRRR